MKRLYLIALLIPITWQSMAQEIDLYGFYTNGTYTGDYLLLGQVDPLTGSVVGTDTIFTINAYALGSSSFDQVNRYYSFIGIDTGYTKRFVSWALTGDSLVSQPAFAETVNDIQYDMNAMVYYGMGNYIVDTLVFDTVNNIYVYDYASRLLTIDQGSGIMSEIKKLPQLRAFPVGGSTFDANSGRYIVNGKDPDFDDRLFVIDAASGEILSSPTLNLQPGQYLNELEYNNVDDKLYGLYRDNNEDIKAIVSVDLLTGATEVVQSLNQVWAFIQGASVFHQQSQSFILYYLDYSNDSRLFALDVTTGEIVSDVPLEGNFTELEVDNNEFAMLAYHSTTSFSVYPDLAEIRCYPNPAFDRLIIQSTSPLHRVTLFDTQGRKVLTMQTTGLLSVELEVASLTKGIYMVMVDTGEGPCIEKISIR